MIPELKGDEDMKNTRSISLKVVRETPIPYSCKISNSRELYNFAEAYIGDSDREMMVAILLDSKNTTLGVHIISIGSLNASIVHPRESFKAAIVTNSAAIIFFHNHPSGDPKPSAEDIELTARLKQAGELLGIRVLDHIVVGTENKYYSFADMGLL